MTQPIRVTIKASEWGMYELTYLQESDNQRKRCCIGHDGIACGLTDEEMGDWSLPNEAISASWNATWRHRLPKTYIKLYDIPDWVDRLNPINYMQLAAFINDYWLTNGLTIREAIDLLRPIFRHLGRTIYFYPNL